MPFTATLIAGDRSGAYRYLPRSIATFASPAAMTAMIEAAGFDRPEMHAMTMGVCLAYVAAVSEPVMGPARGEKVR